MGHDLIGVLVLIVVALVVLPPVIIRIWGEKNR
jgi:hypothetical protein